MNINIKTNNHDTKKTYKNAILLYEGKEGQLLLEDYQPSDRHVNLVALESISSKLYSYEEHKSGTDMFDIESQQNIDKFVYYIQFIVSHLSKIIIEVQMTI